MTRKTQLLTGVAVIMFFLILADYGILSTTEETTNQESTKKTSSIELQKLASVVNSEKKIHHAYALIAPDYAEKVALMETFITSNENPKAIISEKINTHFKKFNLQASNLNIGEPQILGEGVLWFLADISFISSSNIDIFNALVSLTGHTQGFTWQSFKLIVITDKKEIQLSGKLAIVFIKAVE